MLVGDTYLPSKSERINSLLSQTKVAIIREELVALTKDPLMAVVFNQILYWTRRVHDFEDFLKEEQNRDSENNTQPKCGWIYKTAEELIDETMLNISRQTMRRYLLTLMDCGWLMQRRNPENPWDKTTQYRVNLLRLQHDLDKLGYSLEGYSLSSENDRKFEDEYNNIRVFKETPSKDQRLTLKSSNDNIDTITETTSEITTENAKGAREDNVLAKELFGLWKDSTHQEGITLTAKRRRLLLKCFKSIFGSCKDSWISFCKTVSDSAFLMGRGERGWTVTIDWALDPNNLTKILEGNFGNQVNEKTNHVVKGQITKNSSQPALSTRISSTTLSDSILIMSEQQINEGISRIKDPIWKSVSEEVLRNIGPTAFGDLFKAKLGDINGGDKRANLFCLTPSSLYKAERYQFVLLKALQRFYPTLGAVTTEHREETICTKELSESQPTITSHN